MTCATAPLLSLPDEMLLAILKRLPWVDKLASLFNVHERLDRLIVDHISHASFVALCVVTTVDTIEPIAEPLLDRICSRILPQLQQHLRCLALEASSMQRVLLAADYPKLTTLGLFECRPEIMDTIADSRLTRLFAEQIRHILIDTAGASETTFAAQLFAHILSISTKLTELLFQPRIDLADLPATACLSATLDALSVKVQDFDDCLCLLDGRLPHLRTLIIDIDAIDDPGNDMQSTSTELQLISFTLVSRPWIVDYQNKVLPLLRRMPHLQSLTLSLFVILHSFFIDGAQLRREVLLHMSHIRTFADETLYRTHMTIDRSGNNAAHIHMHTTPFVGKVMTLLTNKFSNEVFHHVRRLSLDDNHPFEHSFFQRIAQAFPALTSLYVSNSAAQTDVDGRRSVSVIRFATLVRLELDQVHSDYVKQFLLSSNTTLPRCRVLRINYELLAEVTTNFTNADARPNCARVERIHFGKTVVLPIQFYRFFPSMFVENDIVRPPWWKRIFSFNPLSFIWR